MSGRSDPDGGGWVPAWAGSLSLLAVLMPVGLCPACWPAYLSIASSLGLGALATRGLIGPLAFGLVALAIIPLAFYVKRHRCWLAGLGAIVGASLVALARWMGGHPAAGLTGAAIITASAVYAIRQRSAPRPQLIQVRRR